MAALSRDDAEDHAAAPEVRVEALERLLVERGLIDPRRIDGIVERYATDVGPLAGARVVARAWVDEAFRDRLLADGTAAVQELGLDGVQMERLVVKANSDEVHHVVCCTLCSCYPWAMLGLPPAWYKSFEYRSRVVREPRRVLRELGLELPDEIEVRVWDSTAELRYLVLPQRPTAAAGLAEEELVGWVTRDAMIGVERDLREPAEGGGAR
ncbi:MAG: nitrile hydratase subunit alpha [Acidobacteria bacterium]|nr:MAG: nitrile hydratase subunit alpha [Acidobacteriota bacterium]REK00896.1 MAG: nitrile hydratase subunit alpha [Acidobacteriota bacterium]